MSLKEWGYFIELLKYEVLCSELFNTALCYLLIALQLLAECFSFGVISRDEKNMYKW